MNLETRSIERAQPLVRLQERDYQIIWFLIQMKFAGIEEIHQKFFRITKDGQESSSLRWARERLALLCRLRLVSAQTIALSSRRYFVATNLGSHAVAKALRLEKQVRPCLSIDIRTFEHDLAVLRTRLKLEAESGVTDWVSDRQLKTASRGEYSFRGEYAPDAMYAMPDGTRVALEVEIALKSKWRLQDKISNYVSTFRDDQENPSAISKVLVQCLRDSTFRVWKDQCGAYDEWFNIENCS